ncbi:MAG: ATP-binding protein [Ferruginibacter sp.]
MFYDHSSYRILIVDDDEDDFFITDQYIKNIKGVNFEVEWRYDYKSAMEDICARKYDLYLVDYYLGAKTGLDFIKESFENKCEDPIIILTGKGTPELDAEAMHAGAVDYLIKGEMDTEKLERCIRHVIEKSKSVRTLKSNERKFRHIFERSKDAVFLMDADNFTFVDVNAATTGIFGFEREEITAMSLFELLADPGNEELIRKHLVKSEIVDREFEMKTKTGEMLFGILSLSKEVDNNGKIFLQGIIHDITDLKKEEKDKLRLEKLGMAERLVRTLAHEVRNPLNNINLSLEQLDEEIKSDDARMYIEIITRNSKRIETLIKELLGASRPEIVLHRNDLKDILEEAIIAAADRITLRHMTLIKNFPTQEMNIPADKEQLKIAFLNIIINALEAMEDNGVLSVDLSDTGEDYRIRITDTGCGISEENLSRLFEPYFTAKKNGLGLGLAATMNILQLHKAKVEVKSRLKEGSTFIINIPYGE